MTRSFTEVVCVFTMLSVETWYLVEKLMISIKFLKNLGVVSAAVGIGLSVSPLASAATTKSFTGAYAPSNWTLSGDAAALDTSNAPGSITLTNNYGDGDLVNYIVTSAGTGNVTFDYSFRPNEISETTSGDSFSFLLNGAETNIATNDGSSAIFTGNFSQSVTAGDQFGFELYEDSGDSSPSVTISNFSAPTPNAAIPNAVGPNAAVPFEFSPGLGLLSLCAIFGTDRMRKKLVANWKKLDTETAQLGLEEISLKH